MKRFELIMGIIAFLGIALRLGDILGGSLLMLWVLTVLSMFYYIFSFALFNGIRLRDIFKKASYRHISWKRMLGAIGLGLALAPIVMGVLYKLLFWEGATFQLVTGLATAAIILIIVAIFYFRNKQEFYKGMLQRIAIIGGLGLIVYLTPSETLVDIYYGDHPEYAALYKRVLAEPENLELFKQLRKMRQEILIQRYKDKFPSQK